LRKDGKPLDGEQGQFERISAEDYFAGSRYVRGLKNIEVVLAQCGLLVLGRQSTLFPAIDLHKPSRFLRGQTHWPAF